ncbi:glycosyltransferase [Rhodovulum marinum]|uniref:Glycosyl transferase family 1 n=1 Tax=Rhodovulum marinum TaxID=320662 RepID=A0A4R2PTG2_9RHOB|nr:glycosyltransferase [Rhodovulum marinum]TCP39293.1 glycosyl transferase family 1 [Rhodovulum marinum]
MLFFLSLYEGFGLPVLEAHMCGTPVVCSDAASLAEVAQGFGHFFDGTVEDATRLVLRALAQWRPEDVDKRTAGDMGKMPYADGWQDALLRLYADGIQKSGSAG